ncbi:hypothetical protein ACMHYO_06660 [Allopusillimonas ginsengisoli]|uniref:hypothetical protein n=1 Tax=Allopusillimonas ginsengisoli TaxID=453575 RepID=UPI0039C479F8
MDHTARSKVGAIRRNDADQVFDVDVQTTASLLTTNAKKNFAVALVLEHLRDTTETPM